MSDEAVGRRALVHTLEGASCHALPLRRLTHASNGRCGCCRTATGGAIEALRKQFVTQWPSRRQPEPTYTWSTTIPRFWNAVVTPHWACPWPGPHAVIYRHSSSSGLAYLSPGRLPCQQRLPTLREVDQPPVNRRSNPAQRKRHKSHEGPRRQDRFSLHRSLRQRPAQPASRLQIPVSRNQQVLPRYRLF